MQQRILDYEVYRADDDDITYTRNFYNQDNYSLTLIKSRSPISKKLVVNQKELNLKRINEMIK